MAAPNPTDILNRIIDIVPRQTSEDILCGVSEECAELAQAALKMRRVLTGTDPTPLTFDEAMANLTEEIADLELMLITLKRKFEVTNDIIWPIEQRKLNRFERRLDERDRKEAIYEPEES